MAAPAPMGTVTQIDDGKWLRTPEAEAYSRVSRRQLYRYVKMGVVTRKKDSEDCWVYERKSLDMLQDQVQDGAGEGADLLDAARQFISTMEGPMRLYIDHLRAELTRLTQRCTELEGLQVSLLQARETSLSQAYEREVLGIQAEESEKRKTLATQQVMTLVGGIMSEQKAAAFLSSFTLEQLDAFILLGGESGMLKPEQVAAMTSLRAQRAQREQQTKRATDTEGVAA